MISYKIQNLINPPVLSDIKLGGYIGKHIETFFEGRVFSDYARNTVYQEAEDAFRAQKDDETVVGYWQGEFWGKWIISASRVASYTGSSELKSFIHNAAKNIISLQREDGYIGTYKRSDNFFAPDPEVSRREVGIPYVWNWNIWCRKYTLWGLIEAYDITGDQSILASCAGMASQLIDEVEASGAHIAQTGTFNGLASCSVMKPLLLLYRKTGEKKYLDFSIKIADRWENAELIPGIIANSLSGKRIREWYPNSEKWAKAYEMMSCFDGLLELYRVTGKDLYLEAAKAFYEILVKHEYNPLYSVAFNDVFGDAAYDVNCITEPCDVIHFMRLCYELFTLTGEAKYMDTFELAAYNPMLASGFKDGKWGARGLRGSSRHLVARIQAGMIHNHCCVNNVPRGYINMAQSAVMASCDALYINLYGEYKGQINIGGKTITVEITGDYLDTSEAKIRVISDCPVKLRLRIPSWSDASAVNVDGTEYTPAGGKYFEAAVHNSVITVKFDNSVKIIKKEPHQWGDTEWKEGRWTSRDPENVSADPELFLREPVCLIRKGAVLLCRTKLIGNTEKEMFESDRISPSCTVKSIKRIHTCDNVNLEYEIVLSDGKKEFTLHTADYASGTNMLLDDKRYFSIYF